MKNKKVIFMGTPEFSVPVLKMLEENCQLIGVVTQPDKIVGRNKEVEFSPVKRYALEKNIPVFQPNRIRREYQFLENMDIDLIVTCAYGQIIPKEVLDLPKYGCINVHASLLPKYRGSAPIQWALFNGDDSTGVTIMFMDEGMDTGDIILEREIKIEDSDDSGTLHDKLSVLGKDTLLEVLPSVFAGTVKRIKQGNDFSLAPMIKREDERIDFNNKGIDIINKIRGLNPWPKANIVIGEREIKVMRASFVECKVEKVGVIVVLDKNRLGISCQDGVIYLEEVKPSGKGGMNIKSFINGLNKDKFLGMVVL